MFSFAFRPSSTRLNLVWATSIQVIEKLAGYAVLSVLTRALQPAELGNMFLAATISGIAATSISFGSDQHLVRAVATDPGRSLSDLGEVLSMRLQNMALVFAAINVAFRFIRPDLSPVLLLVTGYDFVEELWFAFSSFFAGHKKLIYRLAIGAALKVLTVLAVSAVAITTRSLPLVLWTYLALDLGLVAGTFLIVWRDFGPVPIEFSLRRGLALMKTLVPFFAFSLLSIIHLRLDTLMVGFMLGVVQVAYYDLGLRLLEVARFVVRPLQTVFYPIFAELVVQRRQKALRRRAVQLLLAALGLGLVAAVGMQLFGDWAIARLFGAEYAASGPPTRVLFLSLPLVYLYLVLTTLGNALRLERQTAWLLALGAALHLALNLVVIPRYGILGAGWTRLASQAMLAGTLLWVVGSRLLSVRRA
jgi:O-antigen/teichoic acid export membrane protein